MTKSSKTYSTWRNSLDQNTSLLLSNPLISNVISRNKILPELGSTKNGKSFQITKKSMNETKNILSKEESQSKLFEKLRQILFTSNISVEQFFQKIDKDGSGEISNLEFINSIRAMGLGLPLKEIEELLIYCDNDKDGKISFQEFVAKFAPR